MNMILTLYQLNSLSKMTRAELLDVLYKVEDELEYKCKKVSKTIDYLQETI